MAARLNMIRAHFRTLSLVDVSADSIATKLLKARYPGATTRDTKFEIDTSGVNEALANSVVNRLATMVQGSVHVAGPNFRTAYDKAVEAAKKIDGFIEEHPIWIIVIVLCVLSIMYPTAIKALGFKPEGIVRGSYAASWQSTYGATVPAESLVSYLQHLGATTTF